MEIEPHLLDWLKKLGAELDRRSPKLKKLNRYDSGDHPIPENVTHSDLEAEYRVLMKQSITNWPELIRKSISQRLDVSGFRFTDEGLQTVAWGHWQRNQMDARARLLHDTALANGRSYAIVWNDPATDLPRIYVETGLTTVVAYSTSGDRVAALRRWKEGDRWFATLYLPGEIWKFQGPDKDNTVPASPDGWQPRAVEGEDWPLKSDLQLVPVVEYAVNGSAEGGEFGTGSAEIAGKEPIVDRINTTIFNGLLAQTYSSFPVRALIGDKIKYEPKKDADGEPVLDDDGNPVMMAVAPVKLAQNRLIQIENKDGKLVQLPEANLDNYIKFAEAHIRHLAAITQTPAHYLLGEMVNLSADAIRAAEAGLISKVRGHQVDLGESHEETVRLLLLVDDPSRAVPDDFETR